MRIVCLSAEGADICARVGAWGEVVAVSAFAPQAGLEHRPVISGFSNADADRIAALAPDLVLCFSDVQAEIAAQLVRQGCTVLVTNQRTLPEIAGAIRLIGSALGRAEAADALVGEFLRELEMLKTVTEPRPRVYFEEWPDPMISGIGWVGELIEHCGGIDVFAGHRGKASRERVITGDQIVAANPDIIVASWCGKAVDLAAIGARPGFSGIRAVQTGEVHELSSDLILQPGPQLLRGARELKRLFEAWRSRACIPSRAQPP